MRKLFLYTILALVLNAASFLIFAIPIYISSERFGPAIGSLLITFGIVIISLIIQTIVGLFFLTKENKKDIGKAILLSVGIISLFGLSIWSRSW